MKRAGASHNHIMIPPTVLAAASREPPVPSPHRPSNRSRHTHTHTKTPHFPFVEHPPPTTYLHTYILTRRPQKTTTRMTETNEATLIFFFPRAPRDGTGLDGRNWIGRDGRTEYRGSDGLGEKGRATQYPIRRRDFCFVFFCCVGQ